MGCQSAPASPQEALVQLIEAAVLGGVGTGQYQNISPTTPASVEQFMYVEQWLDVNAEAVTAVRPLAVAADKSLRFTRSNDGQSTYVISYGWPGSQVRTRAFQPTPGSTVSLLGWPEILPWEQLGGVLVITTPREMADEENHPCKQAFVFKIESPR